MSAPPSNPANRRSTSPPAPAGARPPASTGGSAHGPSSRELVAAQERREQELWRWCLLLLVLLAVALGAEFAQHLEALNLRIAALPVAVVAMIAILVVLVWQRRSRVVDARRELVEAQSQQLAMAVGLPAAREFERLYYVIQRSQQGYRDLIDSFDDPVLALSLEGEILAANRRVVELFGQDFTQVVGHRLDEFLSEPSLAAATAAIPRFEERRHWFGVVKVRLKPSGELRFYDCVMHAVVRDGRTQGVSCLARDVTQERQNEARFAELFNSLQEGVYFTTPEGHILDANPALVRMLGYSSREELMGTNAKDLYFDAAERAALATVLEEQGRLVAREIVLKRKDGTRLTCLDTASMVRDAAGQAVRYQGILVDITARLEMETSLREQQEFARRLIESFPDVIVVLDREGKFTFISNRIREVLGLSPSDLLGLRYGPRAHPDDRAHLDTLVEEVMSGAKTNDTLEYRAQHRDGTWRMLRATVAPIADPDGSVTGMIVSLRDVTELNRLEQQVMQSEKLAAMGQMMAGVAHELNNPLTAILAVSDMLREHSEDPGHRRQLELLHQQARRAADIVQDLLSFARPPAPRKGRVQLAEVLRRALHLHEYSLRRNNVAVDYLPEKGIPEVVGDSNQLIQVFLNLVVNAEQAIREVRESGTIRVRMGRGAAGEPNVWASIQDDGPGIPTDILEKIFDPFFTTKRPGRGTGLGLSISMAIVREHGGEIQVQAAPGAGSVFLVTLPAARTGDGDETGAPAA
ncbi:MAG TPA: PAS domain S-box protein [Candidatus Acidoferrales bacterium]|nr:PAS domain S-box protein [Candidatus Acidoferrales bacterium]